MEGGNRAGAGTASARIWHTRYELVVALVAAVIFVGCIISPPSLMDDVDAVQAQIARNMLTSGDWVTARLDGVAYLEKSPLVYWMMAISFAVFGPHDWAARLPIALSVVALCWVTARFANWAFGRQAGMYAGLSLATCVGLFLFTRILIPDVILTLTIAMAIWSLMRAIDEDESRPGIWAWGMWASMAAGVLLKGLIAILFPAGAAGAYLLITGQLFSRRTWARLRPVSGMAVFLAIAAPWHILATLRNPPYLNFTMHSESGSYHGFFWFYFMNEHVLRFLNLRYPRDYNTVPRVYFWLLHLVWLFPWSAYLAAAAKLSYRGRDRASRTRLMALCWAGFILVFFTFSTTQEYYSMPCYPALALLAGSAIASGKPMLRFGTRALAVVTTACALATAAILWAVRGIPTPGDISTALSQNPDVYTLSLGHMTDLTMTAFAYLRMPLAMAAVAFAIGAVASLRAWRRGQFAPVLALAAMMVLFCHAARSAMVAWDPYLASRPLAEALKRAPEGTLIVDNQYYTFSSVFFYTNRRALLLNGRVNNLEYGSYAPDAPKGVFIDDQEFRRRWNSSERYYLFAEGPAVKRLRRAAGERPLQTVAESGGKYLFTNQ